MRFVLVAGNTETAKIDGISAAGESQAMMEYTPSADAEILAYGYPVFTPVLPVSPGGCPTPALLTRAVRELVDFEFVTAEAGLPARTAAPSVVFSKKPGNDVREEVAVPDARELYRDSWSYASELPDDELMLAETIPGGTTSAMAVLRSLDEKWMISSSLPENPVNLKRKVVSEGLRKSGLEFGDLAGKPLEAVELMGYPVLAVTAGMLNGAAETGKSVTLAGGTQMIAAAALARHDSVTRNMTLTTTSYIADDDYAEIREAADSLDLDLEITDPGFERGKHVAMDRYLDGVAKEGAGMGGALYLATKNGVGMKEVRERFASIYEELV
ncbi:MAG: nicotinate-nucleotide--dimethylbenzimidazole phosphoribosyltransferase [Halobacteria archaeon]